MNVLLFFNAFLQCFILQHSATQSPGALMSNAQRFDVKSDSPQILYIYSGMIWDNCAIATLINAGDVRLF